MQVYDIQVDCIEETFKTYEVSVDDKVRKSGFTCPAEYLQYVRTLIESGIHPDRISIEKFTRSAIILMVDADDEEELVDEEDKAD